MKGRISYFGMLVPRGIKEKDMRTYPTSSSFVVGQEDADETCPESAEDCYKTQYHTGEFAGRYEIS